MMCLTESNGNRQKGKTKKVAIIVVLTVLIILFVTSCNNKNNFEVATETTVPETTVPETTEIESINAAIEAAKAADTANGFICGECGGYIQSRYEESQLAAIEKELRENEELCSKVSSHEGTCFWEKYRIFQNAVNNGTINNSVVINGTINGDIYLQQGQNNIMFWCQCNHQNIEPTEPKPTEPKPTEPKPTEPKPTEPKPTEPKPTEPKPTEPKPTEPKPTEPKPTEPKPTEPKPTEPKYYLQISASEYTLEIGSQGTSQLFSNLYAKAYKNGKLDDTAKVTWTIISGPGALVQDGVNTFSYYAKSEGTAVIRATYNGCVEELQITVIKTADRPSQEPTEAPEEPTEEVLPKLTTELFINTDVVEDHYIIDIVLYGTETLANSEIYTNFGTANFKQTDSCQFVWRLELPLTKEGSTFEVEYLGNNNCEGCYASFTL